MVKAKKTALKAKKTTTNDLLAALVQQVTFLTKQVDELKNNKVEVEEATETPVARRADGRVVNSNNVNGRQKQPAPKPDTSEIKCRYELWAYDEYQQGSIVSSGPRLDKIIDAAKRFVTEQNVDNALAAGEKDKSWEAYFPQVFVDGEPTLDVLYGGNKRDGKHYVYVRGAEKWELRKPDASVQFKFYLGQTSNGRTKSDWYLSDHKGREVSSITDQNLERKTVLFVKVI